MQEKALLQVKKKKTKQTSVVIKLHRTEMTENTASCMNEMYVWIAGLFSCHA